MKRSDGQHLPNPGQPKRVRLAASEPETIPPSAAAAAAQQTTARASAADPYQSLNGAHAFDGADEETDPVPEDAFEEQIEADLERRISFLSS